MTAFAYYLNGAYEDGFKYHEQVLALTVDSIRYLVGPVADAILSSKALLAKYGGRVKAAFEGSMSGAPNDFVNRYRYARLLLALGSTKEANDVLKKNVDYLVEEYRNHPDDGLITMYLALSMTRQGHFSEAEGFAKDAKDLARGNPEILYKIAQMYALQMHSSRGQATIAQMKKKALQSVHEAVNLRFMLNELTNADLYSVYGKDFVVAARLPLK
jgi:tetratricopeptide (TPR) repeat protein